MPYRTQQAALIELAVRNKLMIDTVDNWILAQPSLVNKSKRAVLPVVLQRCQLADGLAKYLAMLGLERRHKVKTLHEILTKTTTRRPTATAPRMSNHEP